MNRSSHPELLYRLRQQLEHFDCSPDFGDREAVAAIRRHLLLRIREAESLSRCRTSMRMEHAEAA